MTNYLLVTLLVLITFSCAQQNHTDNPGTKNRLTEFSDYYSEPNASKFYSTSVSDTFSIFTSLPKGYETNSEKNYPLIVILDANAFYEQVVAELKFNSFIGLIPKSIVVGIGYKNFTIMDSLRSRDYTYPTAIPEYEMELSGGAEQFKNFIDNELVPNLSADYRIDLDKSVLCGHSLAGYFSLYYALQSIQNNVFNIKNIVSASPSLHYNNRFIFEMTSSIPATDVPMKIYISMGSEDMEDEDSKGILDAFENQMLERKFKGLKLKKAEYSNFGHLDAAIPGFMKGLTYTFER